MLSKNNHGKPFVALATILLFLIALTCPAFAKDGADGTELQIAQPQQLTIQLGPEWAGVEFQLKTDSGLYPGTIPVGDVPFPKKQTQSKAKKPNKPKGHAPA